MLISKQNNKKESNSILGLLFGIIFIIAIIGVAVLCIFSPWKPKYIEIKPYSKIYNITEQSYRPIENINIDFSKYHINLSDKTGEYATFGKKNCNYYSYQIMKETEDVKGLTIHYNFTNIGKKFYQHYITINDSTTQYINPTPILHDGTKEHLKFPDFYFHYEVLNISEGKSKSRIYSIYFTVIDILETGSVCFSYYKFTYSSDNYVLRQDSSGDLYEYFDERLSLDKLLHNIFISSTNSHCPYEQYHKKEN